MADKNHPLMEAARYADAQAEEHALEATVSMNGLDLAILQHVAEQRALRLVLLKHRGPEGLFAITRSTKPEPVPLSQAEENDMGLFTAAYFDGLFIGWKGGRLSVAVE